jgi:hypothetical protein
MFGALFTFASFILALYVAVRPNIFDRRLDAGLESLDSIQTNLAALRPSILEALTNYVDVLTTTLAPRGESAVQTLRDDISALRTDMQALATASRETKGCIVAGSMTDSQPPAAVLPEILAEFRRPAKGDTKVQRQLPSFSFSGFRKAYAEDLARERTQATSSSFHDLD